MVEEMGSPGEDDWETIGNGEGIGVAMGKALVWQLGKH
jgi:hypothetical protein